MHPCTQISLQILMITVLNAAQLFQPLKDVIMDMFTPALSKKWKCTAHERRNGATTTPEGEGHQSVNLVAVVLVVEIVVVV